MINKKKGPPITTEPSKCAGCLLCELSCSLRLERAFVPAKAAIQIRRLVDGENDYSISFNEKCDNCGICARYCTYEALTQIKNGRIA